jgi:hypothetical protein
LGQWECHAYDFSQSTLPAWAGPKGQATSMSLAEKRRDRGCRYCVPINVVTIDSGGNVEDLVAYDLQLAPQNLFESAPVRGLNKVAARDHEPVLLIQVQQRLTPTGGEVCSSGISSREGDVETRVRSSSHE